MDVLVNIIIVYVFIEGLDFYLKVIYVVMMIRRVFIVVYDFKLVDDCDFVGNKWLEFVG